jgi:hypothetical protein
MQILDEVGQGSFVHVMVQDHAAPNPYRRFGMTQSFQQNGCCQRSGSHQAPQ